jgi:hypothetical protein
MIESTGDFQVQWQQSYCDETATRISGPINPSLNRFMKQLCIQAVVVLHMNRLVMPRVVILRNAIVAGMLW